MTLLQKKMLDRGRKDFTKYISEILAIAPGNASLKLRSKQIWTIPQARLVAKELDLTLDEMDEIFDLRGVNDEG